MGPVDDSRQQMGPRIALRAPNSIKTVLQPPPYFASRILRLKWADLTGASKRMPGKFNVRN